jgi:flagellar basal-body rod modification protein FlgD
MGSVDKNMFLQLLVAQMRNQDPLNPTDGTQFLGELAQFQQLEQSTNSGEDITAIRQDLDKLVQQGTPSTNGQS